MLHLRLPESGFQCIDRRVIDIPSVSKDADSDLHFHLVEDIVSNPCDLDRVESRQGGIQRCCLPETQDN
jgi:hypothetical protein